MDNHYIDNRFKEELKGLEVNPPVETWLDISDALDRSTLAGKNYVWMRTAAAIAVFVVAAFSLWMIFIDQSLQDDPIVLQTVPVSMDALPSPGLPQSSQGDLLLADLSQTATIGNYQSMLPQPLSAYDPVLPQRMQSFPAGAPGIQSRGLSVNHNLSTNVYPLSDNVQVRDFYLFAESNETRSFMSNLDLGAHFAFQYNYRTFSNQSTGSYRSIPFDALESQIYTFSAGLNATLALSPKWAVQTGLHLNNMGQFVEGILAYQHPEHKSLYSQNQIVVTSFGGVTVYDNSHHFSDRSSHRVLDPDEYLDPKVLDALKKSDEGLTQVFQFLEVPVVFRYKLIGHHVDLHLKGGMTASYLLNKDVYIGNNIYQSPIGKTQGLRQFNFSVTGGFAMQVPMGSRLYLNLEPTAQLFLNPMVQDGLNTGAVLPYSFSLQTGVSYRF